ALASALKQCVNWQLANTAENTIKDSRKPDTLTSPARPRHGPAENAALPVAPAGIPLRHLHKCLPSRLSATPRHKRPFPGVPSLPWAISTAFISATGP